ncbi:MAG TPA: TonB-dependent receptor [Steroidobacteraceae bacterium]|nr:TonB-dependent receptor [Steroidobacteraceae bacterium]
MRRYQCGKYLVSGGSMMLAVMLGAPVGAQQAQSEPQLEEIIVTAEKREATIETTAISITAVSGADIVNRGFTDLASLMQTVPGVSIRTSGPGMTEFEMRGVASNGGNSPTVGFYFDDTPLTAAAATNEGKIVISPDLYDLNRVEVLRGPQGTLYGSGSMGGTIKVVPNAPNPELFEASAEAKFADTDHGGFDHGENAMVNLPFWSNKAALRIVGSYSYDAGWVDRVVVAPGQFPLPSAVGGLYSVRGNVAAAPIATEYHDVNSVEKTAVRVAAVFKPIDGLTITPSYFYQKLHSGGLPYIDNPPATDAFYQPFDTPERYHDEFRLEALSVKYHTDIFEISSATAYWARHEPLVQDTAESWTTALLPAGIGITGYGPGGGNLGQSYAEENNQSHQTTEELRVSSVGDTRFKWLIGYFYSDFISPWDIIFPSQSGASNPNIGTNDLFSYYTPFKILQQSVFGEVTYNITEPLSVTVGARRYHYDAPVYLDQFGGLTPTVVAVTSESAQGVTPKATISYQFDKDLLVYATAAKGFRPGGGTGPVPTAGPLSCEAQLQVEYNSHGAFVPGPVAFSSDSVWSYELGEKWRSSDNRITVNAAAYFESWIGVQQVNPLNCGYVYTANAGNAHVKGGELEVDAIVVRDLQASANVSYSDSTLVSSNLVDSSFNPGTPIQQVPKWTGTVALSYRHDLANNLALTARGESTYVGSRTDATYYINNLSSYDLTNVRAGIDGGRWSAVLFINNVADKRALLNNITQDASNVPDWNRVAVSQPRTAGIDLNYKFK